MQLQEKRRPFKEAACINQDFCTKAFDQLSTGKRWALEFIAVRGFGSGAVGQWPAHVQKETEEARVRFSDLIEQLEADVVENSRKAALRTCLYFSYGYHLAKVSKGMSVEDFIKRTRAYILDKTGSKSQASMRVKTTRLVGPHIQELVDGHSLSDGRQLSSCIDQMLSQFEGSGIHSVKALEDWASSKEAISK